MPHASLQEICCWMGSPVAGNPTHYIMETALRQAGLDWPFLSFEVDGDKLTDAMCGVRAFRFRGVHLSAPLQAAAATLCDTLDEDAQALQAVNAVLAPDGLLSGKNTLGQVWDRVLPADTDFANQHLLLLGDNPLIAAIARKALLADSEVALQTLGDERPAWVTDDDSERTPTILTDDEVPEVTENITLVVSDEIVAESELLHRIFERTTASTPLIVADLAATTHNGPLQSLAREGDLTLITGLDLQIAECAVAIEQWTDVAPDIAAMRDAAEEFLGI